MHQITKAIACCRLFTRQPIIRRTKKKIFSGDILSPHALEFCTILTQNKHTIKTPEYELRLLSTELETLPTICFEIRNRNI